jgi:hypothetical protein
MGLSVSIASAIVFVGWIALAGAISTSTLSTMNALGSMLNSASDDKIKLGVQLTLNITSIEARELNFSVRNTGSRDIFLRNESYVWNSVILNYNNTTSDWQTYLIENYTILSINVTGTDASFTITSHSCLKPGEEALIRVELPSGAPDIPVNSLVTVVFASHYGVSAAEEVFVSQYGQLMSGLGKSGMGVYSIAEDYVR